MRRRWILITAVLGLALAVPAARAQEAPPTTVGPTATTVPPTTVPPRGSVPPPPVLVVEPDSGLVDGQTVALSGTGWGGPVNRGVQLCREEVGDVSQNCIVVGEADADLQGNLSGSATLPASFTPGDGVLVDCLVEQCVVFVSIYRGDGDTAAVSFANVIAASPGFTG